MQRTTDLDAWAARIGGRPIFEAIATLHPDDVVFAVDHDRQVVAWSEGAERVLGWTAAEAVGQHCLKTNRCEACIQGCGISKYGTVVDIPVTLYDKEGRAVPLRKTARGFFDERGQFVGGLEILRPAPPAPAAALTPRPARRLAEAVEFHGLVSVDSRMRELFDTIRHVAETEGTVLLRGESGTGKELVAQALHQESHRRTGAFVAVNCAALSPGLLESELFGHVRGAFTGAVRDRAGVFARAHGGTLFLDEVAELPVELQAKLLRVIQERSFVPVGGTRSVNVDVRIVAATHRSLRAEVEAGRFREDLMYRLRVIPLYLPPLRERLGDVEVLLWSLLQRAADKGSRRVTDIAPDAMRALLDHRWPGNVRELINVVEYATAVGRGPTLDLRDLPPEFREPKVDRRPAPPPRAVAPLDERALILDALAQANGNVGDAADRLGMSRPTFWRKRKKYGI